MFSRSGMSHLHASLVLVFAAVGASAATCADGSSPGTNGCCAATNMCPPSCIRVQEARYGDDTFQCSCNFCAGETAKIDSNCTQSSGGPPLYEIQRCPAEYPDYSRSSIRGTDDYLCECCFNTGNTGSAGICMRE